MKLNSKKMAFLLRIEGIEVAVIKEGMKLYSILITTNHIFIGGVYILVGVIGGSFGSGLSIIIRVELTLPGF
ncbi:MAG: hypothetical protein GY714_21530 [Desulfobacterales bacterium]|nr:hypothetical protein [Desulfobacterales bacterium]